MFLGIHEEEGTAQLKEGCLQAASGVAKFLDQAMCILSRLAMLLMNASKMCIA